MISLKIKKGYDLNIEGAPAAGLEELSEPTRLGFLPDRIRFVKPRLLVEPDMAVKVGTPLMEDKRDPNLKFLSPGGGKIERITFGPRRVIREIVIARDSIEEYEEFHKVSRGELDHIAREELVTLIMKGGLWPLLRELPFRDVANRQQVPNAIYVNLDNADLFHAGPEIYLKGRRELFEFGVKVLKRLAENVKIATCRDADYVRTELDWLVTHRVSGPYPSDDPGTVLYHTKKSASENHSWFISGQDLLLLAELLTSGRYPTRRVVTVAGSAVRQAKHLRTRLGVPFDHLTRALLSDGKNHRFICGGVMRGYKSSAGGFMGFYETALTVMPEGDEEEFLGFVRPGYSKPTHSKAFLSVFNKKKLEYSCSTHGELRPCVNCGYCDTVCAVDILPQFTYKAILADAIEEALEHGLLDCVECGLCSYVCPSKIPLVDTLIKAKADYHKELG